jgi:hypothetical protein|tara:strand:+ start:377 stop:862 length:486 start_codon:yes stop_codon:yes gene_type:complete
MARGAKTLSARPPPQAWLANCLDPTARVVTVSAKELGAMIEAREAKTPKAAPRATAKRSRETGSAGAKYTVTEQAGFVWVTCGTCAKKRYALETFRVGGEEDTTGFKVRSERSIPSVAIVGGLEQRRHQSSSSLARRVRINENIHQLTTLHQLTPLHQLPT